TKSVSWHHHRFRLFDEGFLFDTGGLCAFSDNIEYIAAILNSKVSLDIMSILAPTLNFTVGTVSSLPIVEGIPRLTENANRLKRLSKSDWDSYETSWDFTKHPLLSHTSLLIKDSYSRLLLENSQSLKEYREIG
ncbi:SAM-dependent methyltransferase, partial [Escherichia coli]|nr:SAM-dependent methyltransferase [Escherichia coli]MDQ9386528.1 SAM-dependent methyltransferase [Escherichia coli]